MLSDIQIQELKEVDPQAYNKMRFTNKQLYLDIVAITQDILPDKKTSIIQRIHHVLNNTTEIPLCKTCQEVKVSWNVPGRAYRTYCSSSICSSKDEDAAARQLAAAAVTRAENVGPKFIENLANMKLVLLEPFKSSTDIHKMQCQICEHEFESVPRTRVGVFNQRGSNGCPNCVILARQARSEASRAKTPAKPIKPEVVPYPNRLADIGIKLLVPFTKAKEHHLMQCQTCLHEWSSTPIFNLQSNKKRGGNGCPNCANERRSSELNDIRANAIARLHEKNIRCLSEDFIGAQTTTEQHTFINDVCGHTFTSSFGNILHNNINCSICGEVERMKGFAEVTQQRAEEAREGRPEKVNYRALVDIATRTMLNVKSAELNPGNKPVGVMGAPGAYQYDHIVPSIFGFQYNIPADEIGTFDNMQLIPWEVNGYHSGVLKGAIDNRYLQYLPKIGPWIEYNDFRDALMLTPVYDLKARGAFEITPDVGILYVLSEMKYASRQLLNQQIEMKTRYKQVLVCFEDEWKSNRRLIINKINHITGRSNSTRIHARKCKIVELPATKRNLLLEQWHIQGADKATLSLGAEYNGEIVAVMSFCPPRAAVGEYKNTNKTQGRWELSRFATNEKYRIPGIASKLLTEAKAKLEWSQIYSFADLRWSNLNSNVYLTLGFEQAGQVNPPAYWYLNLDGKRLHRWGFRKSELAKRPEFIQKDTEWENVQRLYGFNRRFDCGTVKYVLNRE